MEQEKLENSEPKERITDDMIIAEWRSMLQTFKDLIKGDPKPSEIKEELMELVEMAKNSSRLTSKQIEGIHDRCMNYINGSYGRNLSHPS